MSPTAMRSAVPISPFATTRPARRRSWLDRLLGRSRPDLAARALKSLVARRGPASVTRTELSEVLLHYGVAGDEARRVMMQLWREVLGTFLTDDALSDGEIAYLDALRGTFALTTAEVEDATRRTLHPRYQVAVADAMADQHVSPEERSALARLAAQLRLPEETQREIFRHSARQALDTVLQTAVSDRRVSPDEAEQLAALSRHFGVAVTPDDTTRAMLDRFALFWRIENGDPPVLATSVGLAAGESCHYAAPAVWYGPPVRDARHEPAEGILSIRIARGVYYRAGSVSTDAMPLDGRPAIDRGTLYVTNKRVILDGELRTHERRLRDIGVFQVYANGLVLDGESTRSAYLVLQGDVELAAVTLGAVLARA